MTSLQLIAHLEQMEAARAEFLKLWQDHLLPHALALEAVPNPRHLFQLQDCCWLTFLKTKGLDMNLKN